MFSLSLHPVRIGLNSRARVCITALCLHSLLLRVQMQTKHPTSPLLPTGLRVPVKRTERSSNKSVSSACLGFNARTGLPFLSRFHSPSFSERTAEIFWCGRTRLSEVSGGVGLNSSKRCWAGGGGGAGVAVLSHLSVGEHQIGDGGLQPVS